MKVDILMATYNGEKYLKEQLDSILNQTHSNFVLHISDDKSTDSTRTILSDYAKKDKRVKLYFQEKNLGYIKNFEFLLSNATADYLMLSDQDDVWMNHKVEYSLNKLKREKLDLVITDLFIVDKELNNINTSYFQFAHLRFKSQLHLGNYLLRNPAVGCTMMLGKSLLKRILPFPELKHPYYVHDWYIYIMAEAYGKVGYLETPLIQYRQHGNNNIGMHRTKKRSLQFIQTARSINLNYRIQFCDELLKRIHNKKKEEILEFKEYLLRLKKSSFINWNFSAFHKYSKLVDLKVKLRYLFVFHLPFFLLAKDVETGVKNEKE